MRRAFITSKFSKFGFTLKNRFSVHMYLLIVGKSDLIRMVLRMRPQKTEASCYSGCGTIKIPPYSKALRAEYLSNQHFPVLHRQW